MGAGIVEVFARNGLDVVAVEIADAALERGRSILTASTDRAVARGKLSEADRDALLARVRFEVGLAALHDVDLVIEAVPEKLALKRTVFAELDRVCKPSAILATNTSSLSVTEIAVATQRPDRVAGLHFFNPAPVMRLVEVVRTVVTADDVVAELAALCTRIGKHGVTIGDRAGFIANTLLFGYLNQAATMYESGHASREDLDAAMRAGSGLPMGPLALLDLIGLDVALDILDTMYRRGGRSRRHVAAPLLTQLVTAGFLGRKSGRGFYTYDRPGSSKVTPDQEQKDQDPAGVREVGAIGVVGSAALARTFTDAGFDVVSVPEPGVFVAGPGVSVVERAVGVLEPGVAVPERGVSVAERGVSEQDGLERNRPERDGLERLTAVDLVVVEAVDGAAKALLARLDGICKPGTPLAVTGSSAPVIESAMAAPHPADVVGLHLTAATLAEVVPTIRSSPDAVAAVRQVAGRLGRTVVSSVDRAGLVHDALLFPYLNDAVRMLEAGYATADDIDAAMTLGCGYPAGPFEMLDALGLDVALTAQRAVYAEQREPGLAPAPLLEHLVTAGYLGRKAGRGFREHS
ncbi:3-hydroxyacyl-CoA dehydrogenase family protein [Catenuloplanes sp. NPDC051500]|uniref:3-hydroxyacyl-CoA dehydrogenase family protein n=1 Tax=Catenuloplanes sp. NPDC051500 TaxID=3363959 RepID=UPI0037B44EF4